MEGNGEKGDTYTVEEYPGERERGETRSSSLGGFMVEVNKAGGGNTARTQNFSCLCVYGWPRE